MSAAASEKECLFIKRVFNKQLLKASLFKY